MLISHLVQERFPWLSKRHARVRQHETALILRVQTSLRENEWWTARFYGYYDTPPLWGSIVVPNAMQ